jgi:hypothetical protein
MKILPIILCLNRPSLLFATNVHDGAASTTHVTRNHLSKIMHTAFDDDATLQQLHDGDRDRPKHDQDRQVLGMRRKEVILTPDDNSWERIIQHGWVWSKRHHNRKQTSRRGGRRRNLRSDGPDGKSKDAAKISPFVVCSASEGQSGFQRREEIAGKLKVSDKHVQTVSNTMEESCFIVSSTPDAIESFQSEIDREESDLPDDASKGKKMKVKSSPLVDALKVPGGTVIGILEDEDWSPPKIESEADLKKLKKRKRVNEFSYDNATEEIEFNVQRWSKSFMVELIPGSVPDEDGIDYVAIDIIEYIKDMAQVPPGPASTTSYLRGNNTDNSTLSADNPVSTREAFSLTATALNNDESSSNAMIPDRHSVWSTALKEGFEAPHGCQAMLDTLEIRPLGDQFEVVLHPPSQYMKPAAVESSAWNKHCALSLLIGISVHPSVQSVEVSQPIVLASIEGKTNPQWITQSGQYNHRPFFSVNLDGRGQGEFGCGRNS